MENMINKSPMRKRKTTTEIDMQLQMIACNKTSYINSNNHPLIALPLTVAALGAFLAPYDNAMKTKQQCLLDTPQTIVYQIQ
eukprot:2643762-Ditylum_brightwellii.AAC.1